MTTEAMPLKTLSPRETVRRGDEYLLQISHEMEEFMVYRSLQGSSHVDIADEMGLHDNTVYRILKKVDIPSKYPELVAEARRRALGLAIGTKLGIYHLKVEVALAVHYAGGGKPEIIEATQLTSEQIDQILEEIKG